MRKKYLKLTSEQRARGVVFSSCLVGAPKMIVHEVFADDEDKEQKIERLKNDEFFNNSPFNYNLIRR